MNMFSMFLLSKRSTCTCGSLCTLEKGVTCTAEVLVCNMYNNLLYTVQTGLTAQGK